MPASPDAPKPSTPEGSTPSAATGDQFRVAVMKVPDDHDPCIQILHEVLGWTKIDARQRLRHVPNIWPDLLSNESATLAAERLQSLGARVAVVSADIVPDLQHALTLHHVRCTEAGFVIVSTTGVPEQTIPWPDFSVLSVARVAGLHEKADNPLPDGVFRHGGGIARYDDVPHKFDLELWLIADNPSRAFRIDSTVMNYEYLGARLSPSSDDNFATLIGDIRSFAKDITLSLTADAYVSGASPLSYRLPSSQVHGERALANWAVHRNS